MKKQMTLVEIEKGINSNDWVERYHAFDLCIGRNDIPLEWLERGINDENYNVRCTVFQACIGRSDVPLEWLERGMNDEEWSVRCTAFNARVDRSDVPLEWLERGVNDKDCDVRCSAFQACAGRSDVPLEWLKKGVNDRDKDVRTTVSKILFDMGYQFPLIRTIEPADKVYKRCLDGVIVVASIPKTAQVRGIIGCECRASEAMIIEIIPNSNGCVEAVSRFDWGVTYKVGDHVVIDDFDHSNNREYPTGYHFFNTIKEVWNF